VNLKGTGFGAVLALLSCAPQQGIHVESSQHVQPPAPLQPKIEGNLRSVSSADLRLALNVMRMHMAKEYGSSLSIYGVYVVDRDRMTMHYWANGVETYGYVDRINGKWRFTNAIVERNVTTGANIPTQ
jgi:hypothetical protein